MTQQLKQHPVLSGEHVLAILSANNIDRLPQVKASLGAVFPHLDVVCPASLEHLADVIKRSAATHRILLTVGGDGTLNQVLNAADISRQIIGIVPAGTGNDFARTIGLPLSITAAIARLPALAAQPTDYGTVNGIRYHNSAGFGVDSATLRLRQQRRGILYRNYNLAFLMALAQLECPQLRIEFDGGEEAGGYFWVLAMNTTQIGGGTRIAPEASISDGMLDMLLIRQTSKLNLLRHMPAALKGRHTHLPMACYRQVRRVACFASQPVDYLALDGELQYCGERQVVFEVHPGGMQFLR